MGTKKNQIINEVVKLQRKAIKIITFNNQFALAAPLFKELKILPFHKMIDTNGKLPSCPKSSVNITTIFQVPLETSSDMQIINTNTTQGKHTIVKLATIPHVKTTCYSLAAKQRLECTIKWGNIKQFSMFFLNKIEYHNHMGPILQT